jgi:peptide/nickel transport system substrate-binding protein
MSIQFASVDNISQFQYMMYRPLYYFGASQSTSPTLNSTVSLAQSPVYSNNGTQAVINLKNYKWSNGETVSSDDVVFFLNLLHAEKANWYAYAPGTIPDNITSVTVNSPTQLTIKFNSSYNSFWMTYNELSQVTPFPKAWDIKATGGAAGSGGCSTGTYGTSATDAACTAVYNYLSGQAGNLANYDSSPLWTVVDGPFTINSSMGGFFDSSGDVTMVPNPTYSGPVKPSISKFIEVPFTTDDAEFNALLGGKLDIGFLPQQDLTAATTDAQSAGPNNPRLSSFYLSPWILFGYNYFPLNYNSIGDGGSASDPIAGDIFKQLYFRQAMQSLIDQPLYINRLLRGYGVPTYGPVPVLPPNSYVTSLEKTNPYPYSVTKAKSLLSSHGWKVTPGGTDTCVNPGSGPNQCGAGIPGGTPLSFTLQQASGILWQTQTMAAEKSSWSQAGINVNVTQATFNTVIGTATPCTPGPSCAWEMEWWGGGWEYSPDYYPSGDELFLTGAGSNQGSYSDPQADALIKQTYETNTNLASYQNYIAKQVAAIWQPNADYELTEARNTLRGLAPQNPFANLLPEYLYYTK